MLLLCLELLEQKLYLTLWRLSHAIMWLHLTCLLLSLILRYFPKINFSRNKISRAQHLHSPQSITRPTLRTVILTNSSNIFSTTSCPVYRILVLMEHTLGEEIYYSTTYQPVTREYVQYLTFQRLKVTTQHPQGMSSYLTVVRQQVQH